MSYTAEEILDLREKHKDLRDQEFTNSIGISEAELFDAYCTVNQAQRLRPDVSLLLKHATKLNEVLALTRNEYAVHERTGHFQNVFQGVDASLTLGEIDLRIFQDKWKFAFARDITIHDNKLKSFQFFDAYGDAIFKLYTEKGTNLDEWHALNSLLQEGAPTSAVKTSLLVKTDDKSTQDANIELFRQRWENMTDVHQLHDILTELKIGRHDAVKLIGTDYANKVELNSIELMLKGAIEQQIPIMCFVGNPGCIQIFTGTVQNIKTVDGWFNILDEKFHLHLLTAGIDSIWYVRKPTSDGHISSLEAFDSKGRMILQFFGKRNAGDAEREDWRSLLATLPLVSPAA